MQNTKLVIGDSLSLMIVFLFVAFVLLYYFVLGSMMPDKFFYDMHTILSVMQNLPVFKLFDAYGNTARIYSLFPNIFVLKLTILACFIWFSAYLLLKTMSFFRVAVSLFFLSIAMIYLTQPSKEFVVFLLTICIMVYFSCSGNKSNSSIILAVFIPFFVYGLLFRGYFLAIDAVFFGIVFLFEVFLKRFREGAKIIISIMLVVCMIDLLVVFMPSHYWSVFGSVRNHLNAARMSSSAAKTAFLNPLQSNNVIGFIGNYFYSILRFLFPVFFVFKAQTIVLQIFIILYAKLILENIKNKSLPLYSKYISYFLIAVFSVQMLFEPDYGSFLKHNMQFVSMLLFAALIPKSTLLEVK